jgi:hypothetical protein
MLIALYAVFIGYTIVAIVPMGNILAISIGPLGNFLVMSVGMLIIGVSVPVVNIMLATTNQSVIPLDMQGRVAGVLRALASAISPLGMIFSISGEFIGISTMYLVCAIFGFIAISITWVKTDVRKVVEIPPQPTKQRAKAEPVVLRKKEEEE